MDLVALDLTLDRDDDGKPDVKRGDMTALQLAAMYSDPEAAEFLIRAGADIHEGGYGDRR